MKIVCRGDTDEHSVAQGNMSIGITKRISHVYQIIRQPNNKQSHQCNNETVG